jgi:hypothetical protein
MVAPPAQYCNQGNVSAITFTLEAEVDTTKFSHSRSIAWTHVPGSRALSDNVTFTSPFAPTV